MTDPTLQKLVYFMKNDGLTDYQTEYAVLAFLEEAAYGINDKTYLVIRAHCKNWEQFHQEVA